MSLCSDRIEYTLLSVNMVSLYANQDLRLFSFTPDSMGGRWGGGTSDRTIFEQPSPKRQSDFLSRAGCSECVTQLVAVMEQRRYSAMNIDVACTHTHTCVLS